MEVLEHVPDWSACQSRMPKVNPGTTPETTGPWSSGCGCQMLGSSRFSRARRQMLLATLTVRNQSEGNAVRWWIAEKLNSCYSFSAC